jgi:hypothetical protein
MPTLFGQDLTKEQLNSLTGDLSQVAGIRLMSLTEGRENGVRIADVRTGSGLRFQVTLDRAMDISAAEYKGIPLAWRSPAGDVHPSYYEPEGGGWNRTFPGGLVTTCGMASAGAPSEDEGIQYGLHGRLSNTPATGFSSATHWEGNTCRFVLGGVMREYLPFVHHLVLHRTIEVSLGASVIRLRDVVCNEGASRTPLMMLYHCNLGWPLVSPASRLVLRETGVTPRDAEAAAGLGRERQFELPSAGYHEQVFYHDLAPDAGGFNTAAMVNTPLGIGLSIRYRRAELPYFTQWKMMGKGMYVVGLEPGNCLVGGRAEERAAGRLSFLEPGEQREFALELGVLEGEGQIQSLETN